MSIKGAMRRIKQTGRNELDPLAYQEDWDKLPNDDKAGLSIEIASLFLKMMERRRQTTFVMADQDGGWKIDIKRLTEAEAEEEAIKEFSTRKGPETGDETENPSHMVLHEKNESTH